MQLRINMETMQPDGGVVPGGGTITAFELPTGPGIRIETLGYVGYATSPRYDSLLAKLVAHVPAGDHAAVVRRAARALAELRIDGVPTNAALLEALLR